MTVLSTLKNKSVKMTPPKDLTLGSLPPLGLKRQIALGVMCMTLLIVSLDATILNIALPALVRGLNASNIQLEWIVDSYAVVSAGLLIFAGSLGDRVGHKLMLVVGLVIFTCGSLGSALSPSVDVLIFSRSVMGIGAACIMPATLSIITSLFRRQSERALAIGIWSGTEGIGIALGPIAGGWLLAHYWWGSVFLINVPIGMLAAVLAAIMIPNYKSEKKISSDWAGVILSVSGISLFLWGIIEAPLSGWTSPSVMIPSLGGLIIIALFVMWEFKTKEPMVKMNLFKKSRFSVAMISEALIIFVLMGLLFLMTQYLQFSLGFTPFSAGLRILPVAVVLGVIAPISTLVDKVIGTKITVAIAMLTIAVGCYMLSDVSVTSTYHQVLIGLLVVGFGAGMAFPPATESVMGALKPESVGVGSATNSSALQLGGALGVGVVGTALTSRYQSDILKMLSGHNVPTKALTVIKGSLGGALQVAHIVGGNSGKLLAVGAKISFISGMDLGLKIGGFVAVISAITVILFLPARGVNARLHKEGTPKRRLSDEISIE